MNKTILVGFFMALFSVASVQAEEKYFLCGPDEDGCTVDEYQYCLCMPYDKVTANMPYCLDFNTVSCKPLSQIPDCNDVFKNQSDCVATAFQSEAEPPCPIKTKSFCQQHSVPICQSDSTVETCRA